MIQKGRPLVTLTIGGLFLFLDRFLKWQALGEWSAPRLLNEFFGWQPSLNQGVAFGIPLPDWLIIGLTAPIILLVAYLLYKNIQFAGRRTIFNPPVGGPIFNISLSLILAGALSNFFDRLAYGGTIDYFLLLTAVINLADVMIVAGFGLYLLSLRAQRS